MYWLQNTQLDSAQFYSKCFFHKITSDDEKDKQIPSQRGSSCKVSISLLHVKCVPVCMCVLNDVYCEI